MEENYPLETLAYSIHKTSREKGFYGPTVEMDKVAAKLALVHSEVTEVLEALRKEQGPDAVTEEIVDILIRTLDIYDFLVATNLATPGIDEVMANKMEKNANRPPKHGWVWG